MLFGNDRQTLRQPYFDTWQKMQSGAQLTPLEQQLAHVIEQHPEYHALLGQADAMLDKDYTPEHGESNPFLHMSLHMAIGEQVQTDRPMGIRALYQGQLIAGTEAHALEHIIMEHLMACLWQAQRDGVMPDEHAYLETLKTALS